jgi:hypothetical protein
MMLPAIEVEDIAPSLSARLGVKMADTDGRTLPWLAARG